MNRTVLRRIVQTLVASLGMLGARVAHAGCQGYLTNETGLAYNQTYTLQMSLCGGSAVSATASYSSATFHSKTFGDGSTSSGSITFADGTLTQLSSAAATNSLTVLSTAASHGLQVIFSLPGGRNYQLREGINWRVQASTDATALNLAEAIQTVVPGIDVDTETASETGVINMTTQSGGALFNQIAVISSNADGVAPGAKSFSGGQDNAVVAINGVNLRAGRDWQVGSSASDTATNLAAAINADPSLSLWVTATPTSGAVGLVSKRVGTVAKFALASSAPAAAVLSGAHMTGSTNSSYALNSPRIAIANHGFTLALPVLYTRGSSPVIGGLTSGTTYYAIPVDANTVELATTSARAQAGQYLTLTSSSTQSTAHSYTLAPLAITGTPGFKWQGSNDGATYFDLSVASVTMNSYTTPPTTTSWDFGAYNYQYLRLNATAPTTGGIFLQTYVYVKP
jgi:hypothetical protein